METIHIKTIDPVSQDLLRLASQRGISLSWDRYEKMQPQDGFLRLGLSCPFGCMQGPCRIDPFGRGSEKGLCGLNRDAMVAAMLLRLCLQGVMDTLNVASSSGIYPGVSFSGPLADKITPLLSASDHGGLSTSEVINSAVLLQRPTDSFERLVKQALRLSLLTVGLLEQSAHSDLSGFINCRAGYGVIADNNVHVGMSGRPSETLLDELLRESLRDPSSSVHFCSLGEWIRTAESFLPLACSSGEAELLISSGAIHLLVAGSGTDPGLIEICNRLDIPVVLPRFSLDAGDVIQLARKRHRIASQSALIADTSMMGSARVVMSIEEMQDLLKKNPFGKFALLGGADTPQLPMGYLPVELASALRSQGFQVAGWGDAALWMIKAGMASDEHELPVRFLDARQGCLMAVKSMAAAQILDNLKGICFTGLKDCRDFSLALGLAFIGCDVLLAVPVPLWGSRPVRDLLTAEMNRSGGSLVHFDHPAQAREILEWFTT